MKKIIIAFLLTAIVATGFILASRESAKSADVGLRLLQTIPQHGHSGPNDGGILHTNATSLSTSVGIVISAGTATVIPWDTKILDPLSTHSTTTNTSRIVIPTGYNFAQFTCSVSTIRTTASGNNGEFLYLAQNGITKTYAKYYQGATAFSNAMINYYLAVTPGDYLECGVQNNDGANDLTVGGGSTSPSYINVVLYR